VQNCIIRSKRSFCCGLQTAKDHVFQKLFFYSNAASFRTENETNEFLRTISFICSSHYQEELIRIFWCAPFRTSWVSQSDMLADNQLRKSTKCLICPRKKLDYLFIQLVISLLAALLLEQPFFDLKNENFDL